MKSKVSKVYNSRNDLVGYSFECLRCKCSHLYYVSHKGHQGATWKFNGDIEKPSFTPSLLVNAARLPHTPRCHLFVTDGFIRYLADCTHDLAGQTIEMQPIE